MFCNFSLPGELVKIEAISDLAPGTGDPMPGDLNAMSVNTLRCFACRTSRFFSSAFSSSRLSMSPCRASKVSSNFLQNICYKSFLTLPKIRAKFTPFVPL